MSFLPNCPRTAPFLLLLVVSVFCIAGRASGQVNSGSDGRDGALNPTQNITIDMADHPDGVYQYTSVNIPSSVTVSFIPNTTNTPIVWLVQDSCVINGTVDIKGADVDGAGGAAGGPGGYAGGTAYWRSGSSSPGPGLGPGGGKVLAVDFRLGGSASYGTLGEQITVGGCRNYPPGDTYGSNSLLPLIGGSGGSGSADVPDGAGGNGGGGGGGGALLVVASNRLEHNGRIEARGGYSNNDWRGGGGGSGGAVRLVATNLSGGGQIDANGGGLYSYFSGHCIIQAGKGRVRLEGFADTSTFQVTGVVARGLQSIILYPNNQEPKLSFASIAGTTIPPNPAGRADRPDIIIPGEQENPATVVLTCHNIPLNSDIIVEVKPYNGPAVSATSRNSTGTIASSTATVLIDLPRGGGTIQAHTTANLILSSARPARKSGKPSLFETGLAMSGERFKSAEIRASLGGHSEVVFITESGKRIPTQGRSKAGTASTRPS